ncbi:g7906 [Coccomyxa viridis]|uniref:G7906 protein n=1 Tax=Coccomyxa viridis TaxID=1274662 RepID=A0ABP1FZ12_9CHLO
MDTMNHEGMIGLGQFNNNGVCNTNYFCDNSKTTSGVLKLVGEWSRSGMSPGFTLFRGSDDYYVQVVVDGTYSTVPLSSITGCSGTSDAGGRKRKRESEGSRVKRAWYGRRDRGEDRWME